MNKLKTYFNWSTGKDSALALHYLLKDKNYNIEHLLTSVNRQHNRVSMHGLRRELLQEQIKSLNLPYSTIELPEQPSMQEYEGLMEKEVSQLQQQGFTHAAFGDIFLEDLRKYREQQLSALNVKAVFPLWKKDTRQLLTEFIDLGFKSILICVKSDLLDSAFAGRIIDKDFIKDLPPNVDVCGENGEFHTFCFDGPIFKNPIPFEVGEKVYREYKTPKSDSCSTEPVKSNSGFWFCDLLPVKNNQF
ncbi:adenine nucleotide alpha hydrolase [Pedobacter sp. PAMC26386]|nr:adenine nucleotide alpha hydrolase [Pedobacter sp. PAMC26386]